MTTRRILVTGATGFIGRHTLAPLRDLGFEVHAAARDPADLPAGVHGHAIDLIAPNAGDATHELLETLKPTHLLHLAWYAEHGKFWNSPHNLDWLAATLGLIRDFAAAGGTRFVGAGTCAEYDWSATATENRLDEEQTPLRPATLYGAAKASAFMTGSVLASGANLSFAWGRVFHLFGAGENGARLVPALIKAHLTRTSLTCGSASQVRDFLPVTDVAEAFVRLCDTDVRGAVNIGSGHETSMGDLSEAISALAGSRGDIRFGGYAAAGPERLVPSVQRLTVEAGWQPPQSLTAGLKDVVEWWRARLSVRQPVR